MANQEISTLPIAVRVFPEPPTSGGSSRSAKFWREPAGVFVIHIYSGATAREKLVGSYRLIVAGECLEEGLFYGPKVDVRVLKDYRAQNAPKLLLLPRHEFLKRFYDLAYKTRCLVIGFDLPFILSRLAFDSPAARRFFAGGFSLGFWRYTNKEGRQCPDKFRPRVCVKYIDRKRALIAFTGRRSPDQQDLIPEGSPTGEPKPGYKFPGHFLDLRTLAFALADEVYSLESACGAFGVKHGNNVAMR